MMDSRLSFTNLTLQVIMVSLQLGHAANVYRYINTSINLLTTKQLHKMGDQHAGNYYVIPTRSHNVVYSFLRSTIKGSSDQQILWVTEKG